MMNSRNRSRMFIVCNLVAYQRIERYLFVMIHLRRHLASLLLALVYLLTGFGLEFEHHDDVALSLHPSPRLSAHACGGTGHHVPVDPRHVCPACSQSLQRVSTPAPLSISPGPVFVCTGVVLQPADRLVRADRHFSGTRAPPPLPF